jgi:hypothetical protein
MSNSSDPSALDLYYPPYKATVYDSLFTGMVYGEGLAFTHPIFEPLHVITGAYIVAYVTSAYILLWVIPSKEGQCTLTVDGFQEKARFHFVSA